MRDSQFLQLLWISTLLASPAALGDKSLQVNNIITVAATGDPGENCDSLLNVLGSISDSDDENPYHVKLEPGQYECGDGASINVPQFVTVEGTGIGTTVIYGSTDGALVNLMNFSELRFLTVSNAGSPTSKKYAVSLAQTGGAIARVFHVRAETGPANSESFPFRVSNDDTNGASVVELVVHHSYGNGVTGALKCENPSLGVVRFSSNDNQLLTNDFTPPLQSGCDAGATRCVNSYNSEYDPLPKACFQPAPTICPGVCADLIASAKNEWSTTWGGGDIVDSCTDQWPNAWTNYYAGDGTQLELTVFGSGAGINSDRCHAVINGDGPVWGPFDTGEGNMNANQVQACKEFLENECPL